MEENCELYLISHYQHEQWLIYSDFSKNITGAKIKFLQLKELEKGNVIFRNDAIVPIRGNGITRLDNNATAQNLMYVDGLKHAILSVSQFCDNECELIFRSNECETKNAKSGKIVTKAIRSDSNMSIFMTLEVFDS